MRSIQRKDIERHACHAWERQVRRRAAATNTREKELSSPRTTRQSSRSLL